VVKTERYSLRADVGTGALHETQTLAAFFLLSQVFLRKNSRCQATSRCSWSTIQGGRSIQTLGQEGQGGACFEC
jgi:hypothetical protein